MLENDFKQYGKDLPFVSSKEIYQNGNTEKFHPEGLYSEVIFGSRKAYQCSCGALNHKSNEGETCDFCGVTVDNGSRRKEQYAKIKIKKKILLPIFEKGLQSIFGAKAVKDILSIGKYKTNLVEPFFFDITTVSLKKRKSIKNKEFDGSVFSSKPVYDIASLNKLFDFIITEPQFRPLVEININPKHFNYVFTDEILVYPPETRPIVSNGQKKDIPDIAKFYKKLLANSAGSFWDKEKNNEEYNKNIYFIQKTVNEMYSLVYERGFIKKDSVARESLNGATVEYSARATIIPEPALKPYAIGLAKDTVMKVFAVNFLHFIYKKIEKPKIMFNNEEINDPNLDVFNLISLLTGGKFDPKISDELFDEFVESDKRNLICIIERAPVLWRFNFSGVIVEIVLKEKDGYAQFNVSAPNYNGPRLANTTGYNNKVMMLNTMVSAAFNFDFDGDNMSIYGLHSNQAKKDFYNAFLGNPDNLKFEHNGSLVANPEHEAVYAIWALTEKVKDVQIVIPENPEVFNRATTFVDMRRLTTEPEKIVKYIDKEIELYLPYSIAALNKAAMCTLFTENPGAMPKKKTKRILNKLLGIVGEKKFYDHFHEFNKFALMCSTMVGYCNPTFSLGDFSIYSENIQSYKTTLIDEPFIGFHQNDILFSDYVKPEIAKNPMNSLHRVFESDARIKSVQLLKAASNNGIPTDIHGKAFIKNIKEDLLSGHTKSGFFQSGDSARLALAQRQEAIPRGGELQRRFYWITGFLKLAKFDNCGTKRTFPIFIRDQEHLNTLHGRWYIKEGDVKINHNILNTSKIDLFCIDSESEEARNLIGNYVNFRSPIFCEQPGYKICDKCMGTIQTKSVNLGAAIGSYIPEAIIQSVLRTHHFSGAFITKILKPIIELINRNRFESPNLVFIKLENLNDFSILKEFYSTVYEEEDIQLLERPDLNTSTEKAWEIKVINPPYNDDSVKQLNKIIQVLDKDRNNDNMMPLEDMYNQLLDEIVLPNGIISVYIELIMSLMFYDENDTIIRYGGDPHHQSALKKVINKCDPRLSLFYNLNENAVALILKDGHKILGAEHMLSGLLSMYKK